MTEEKIVLYENLRTPSYTPFYLAQAEGLFEAEGVDVELRLSPAPAETAAGLVEGRADVAFGGPMRVMMHHDAAHRAGRTSPLVCFAQVVARDPFLLVGRAPNPAFRFEDLVGPRVAVAVDVPTPWMTLFDDLDRAGIEPASLNRTPDAPMADNAAALERGEIDVVQVFEPYADRLVSIWGGARVAPVLPAGRRRLHELLHDAAATPRNGARRAPPSSGQSRPLSSGSTRRLPRRSRNASAPRSFPTSRRARSRASSRPIAPPGSGHRPRRFPSPPSCGSRRRSSRAASSPATCPIRSPSTRSSRGP